MMSLQHVDEGEQMTDEISVLASADAECVDRVVDLVEAVVCGFVERSDEVALNVVSSGNSVCIEVSCATDDRGRVIGRRGRAIRAVRTLARALGSRLGLMVDVEVLG